MKLRYKKVNKDNKSYYVIQVEYNNKWNDLKTSSGQKYFVEREFNDIKEHKKEYKLFWSNKTIYKLLVKL